MTLKNIILASRLQTLTAILGPVLVGAFMAMKVSPAELNMIYIIPILLAGFCIQIATNFFNDYLDSERGGDKEDRLGPSRITALNLAESLEVKKWAYRFCVFALIIGIPVVYRAGWPFLVLGLTSLFLSYLYTGTRFSLAYNGIADAFVILFFGGIAVSGTFYILTLTFSWSVFLIGLQLGCLCDILLVVNNLRDQHQDIINHKKTLIVRFGRKFGLIKYLLLILLGFLPTLFWPSEFFNFKLLLMALPWLLFSLYFWRWVSQNSPSTYYNKILKMSSLTYLGFCLSICISLKLF